MKQNFKNFKGVSKTTSFNKIHSSFQKIYYFIILGKNNKRPCHTDNGLVLLICLVDKK